MNLIKWSELLTEWIRLGVNVYQQEADPTFPDTIVTKIEEVNKLFSYHYIKDFNTSYPKKEMVFSIYAKAGERKYLELSTSPREALSFDVRALFNLEDGTLTEGSGVITDALNGWYRCSVTSTVFNSSVFGIRTMIVNDDKRIDYKGEGGKGLYLTRAQFEEGNTPGQYEETMGYPR